MKKNNMLRIASVLLVAVLLSTCAISGAFAKYTTSGSASDEARVAKFGIEIAVTGGEAFAETYETEDDDAVLEGDNSVSVAVAGTALVAPGTSGNLGSAEIGGTSEVAVRVKKTGSLTLAGWDVKVKEDADSNPETPDVEVTKFYCPIVITINGTPYSGLDYDSANAFMTDVNAALTLTKDFDPNYDFDDVAADAFDASCSWAWEFADVQGSAMDQSDELDTQLGRLLADDNNANDPTIALSFSITVEQID